MIQRIIFSGFGGQGVLTAGLVVAEAAMRSGFRTTYFPSYGAEMRGGTANCHVIISDEEIASPVISEADTLIAISKPALLKFMSLVRMDGFVLANVSETGNEIEENGKEVLKFPFEKIALDKLGNSKMANVVMIGVYVKKMPLLTTENVKNVLKDRFGKKGEEIVSLNFQAFDLGFQMV